MNNMKLEMVKMYKCTDGKMFSADMHKSIAERHQAGLNLFDMIMKNHERLRINFDNAVRNKHEWERIRDICHAIVKDIDHLVEMVKEAKESAMMGDGDEQPETACTCQTAGETD